MEGHARRPEPRLSRARRDRGDGDVRAGADPGSAARAAGHQAHGFVNREAAAARKARGASSSRGHSARARARRGRVGARRAAAVPRLARRAGVDLLHSLASTAPAWGAFRRVVTIQDLIYRRYPEAHPGACPRDAPAGPAAARRSDRIIAPSRATRDDLVRLLGSPPRRSTSFRSGSEWRPSRSGSPRGAPAPLRPRARPSPHVSAKRPHKNLARLLDALRCCRAGRPISSCPATRRRTSRSYVGHAIGSAIHSISRLGPRDELEGLYGARPASSFRPSTKASGCPCSRRWQGRPGRVLERASLGEVVEDAALASIRSTLRR